MEHKKHHQAGKKAAPAPKHSGHSGAEMHRYYPEPIKKEHIHPTHMRQGQEPEKKHEYTRQQY